MTEHETRDLPPLGILAALAGIFVLIAVTAFAVGALLQALQGAGPRPSPFPPEPRAGPPLEVNTVATREALEAEARHRLTTYGWTDRERGIARIPVERAMAILAAHGWPDQEPEAPPR